MNALGDFVLATGMDELELVGFDQERIITVKVTRQWLIAAFDQHHNELESVTCHFTRCVVQGVTEELDDTARWHIKYAASLNSN